MSKKWRRFLRIRKSFHSGGRIALVVIVFSMIFLLSSCVENDEGDFGIEGVRHFGNLRANNPGITADDLTYTFNRCNGVYNELKGTYKNEFYWSETDVWEIDLHKEEDGGIDEDMADGVDLFYIDTHGRHDNGIMKLAYDANINKWIGESSDWKLGDNDLEWLVMYACSTINRDNFEAEGWGRYYPLFHGLHLILGAWGDLWDGITTDEVGEDFADNLLDGDTLKSAWFDGVSDWWCDQEAAILSAERAETWNGGNLDWSQTTMNKDHYHGKGSVKSDIPHNQIYWIGIWWIDG